MSFARLLGLRKLLAVRPKISIFKIHRSNHSIDLSDAAVQKYLRHLVSEYSDLNSKRQLDRSERLRLNEIGPIVKVLDERVLLHESIDSLKELNKQENKDEDMRQQIKKEAEIYLSRLGEIDNELKEVLLETNLTKGNVIIEVTAGAGGQEAMLFAGELLEMYKGYAEYRSWEVEVVSLEKSDLGGLRKGSLLIEGEGVPELMKLEAGVHRVQRIPSTERGGRIHTSTVTVAVLPQATELDIVIPDRDVHVETKRASGAGGQHVNTTDSAVRLTHIPTGTMVECQEGRSQIKNKKIAFQKLRTLLLQRQIDEQSFRINAERRSQIGSGERNEKIRTYNFPQDRVTEHRLGGGSVHDLKGFLSGGEPLGDMQEAVLKQTRFQRLIDEMQRLEQTVRTAD